MLNAQTKRIFYHIHEGELSEIDTNEIKFPVVLDSIRIGFTIQQNILVRSYKRMNIYIIVKYDKYQSLEKISFIKLIIIIDLVQIYYGVKRR